ncbi:MAG: helix-turn-helix transcriptional regulator [Solirubrobacterales bacterium]
MGDKYLIYNRVRDLRNKNNLTQEQLAELVNVTRLTIISIERQKYEPSVGLAIRLAKVLGTSIEQLFWLQKEGE